MDSIHIPFNDTVYTVRVRTNEGLKVVTVDSNNGREYDWALLTDDNRLLVLQSASVNLTPWNLVRKQLCCG